VPRRPHLIGPLLLGSLVSLGSLAACGGPSEPSAADRATCTSLVDAFPASFGGVVVHKKAYAASWGSLSLRCGVGRPKGFQATSECLSVAGVDWYAPPGWMDDAGSDVDLTTVSLTPRTQLHVPAKDRGGAAAAALADLGPVLKAHLRPAKRCQ
jgi:hypothetical protein